MKKSVISVMIAAALAANSPVSQAYEAGDILVRAGITNVAPKDSSGKVHAPAATQLEVGVGNDTQLGLNLVYFLDNNWAVEVLAATPFEHDIDLQLDNLGLKNGLLATVTHLPPTISALYYFGAGSGPFQPYAGIGVNYTTFFEEEFSSARTAQNFSDLKLDDSWGLAAQLGFDYQLDDRWQLNASIRYIDISTTANFDLGGKNSYVDVDINPVVTSLMIGYKF